MHNPIGSTADLHRRLSTEAQIESNFETLERSGLLQDDDDGRSCLVGIDQETYPAPSSARIVEEIDKRAELVGRKVLQGFTDLLIVPVGAPITATEQAYHRLNEQKLYYPHLCLDRRIAIPVPRERRRRHLLLRSDMLADQKERRFDRLDWQYGLDYHPRELLTWKGIPPEDPWRGHPKSDFLDPNKVAFPGWQVLLVRGQTPDRSDDTSRLIAAPIPRHSEAEALNAHLSAIQADPEHDGEVGYTPETWLYRLLLRTVQGDGIVDDEDGLQTAAFLVGVTKVPRHKGRVRPVRNREAGLTSYDTPITRIEVPTAVVVA